MLILIHLVIMIRQTHILMTGETILLTPGGEMGGGPTWEPEREQ